MKPRGFFGVLAALAAAVPLAAQEHKGPVPVPVAPLLPASVSVFFGGPGGGTVRTLIGEINCSADCAATVGGIGRTITLTATADATSLFAGWGGPSCSGTTATCTVTLAASNRVVAYFRSAFKTVAAGAYHTCALRPAGNVVCWGRNSDGQLGIGNTSITMGSVTGLTNAVAIAAGGYHTYALIVGGTVQCWGNNNFGQAGVFNFGADVGVPTTVSGITGALAVTTGGYHTCVVIAGGSASCWGLNRDGQLGAITASDHSFAPVAVPLGTNGPLTRMIAAGGFHTCAIVSADSTVACWGSNSDGQLGLENLAPGGKVQKHLPPCTSGVQQGCAGSLTTSLTPVTAIAASIGVGQMLGGSPLGGYHTVAIDIAGNDWGWGNNNDGQVSLPKSSPLPGAVMNLFVFGGDRVLKIAAGAYHTCMLSAVIGPVAPGIFCHGNNNNGQSGPLPGGSPISLPGPAVDVAAGGYHSCAVVLPPSATGGPVLCWGLNGDGETLGLPGGDVTAPIVVDP